MIDREALRRAQAQVLGAQRAPKANQERPEKMCGLCVHFSEGVFSGEGVGTCDILKMASDILADPPIYDKESVNGYKTMNLMNAAKCVHYQRMDFVDKDGTECSDPRYRRSMRQMQDL
ncbi:MAG: hypothetical protein HZB23_07575 [Deltaproteobacteria bacterium]|nr:hypothetical protein [Deltaproteobacteria bacterium]